MKPKDNVKLREFPFCTVSEAEGFRNSLFPHFSTHTIRESQPGKVGLYNRLGYYHRFTDHELKLLGEYRMSVYERRNAALDLLEGAYM